MIHFTFGGNADLWLQITMANLPFVKNKEHFPNLGRNFLRLRSGGDRIVSEILAEIAVRDVLQRNVDSTRVLVPAEECDEEMAMLFRSASDYVPSSPSSCVHTSCRSINASISCVLSCNLEMAFTARISPDSFSCCSQTSLNAPAHNLYSRTHAVRTLIWR